MKLTMLQPRVQTIRTSVAKPLAVERQRGEAWMKTRERILKRDHGLCRCDDCARQAAPLLATEVDHRIPLWDGGSNADSNLQSLNAGCHARKTSAEAARRARPSR